MRILIDGYNLLHASAVFPSGSAAPTLRRSREALLNHLARLLGPELASQTTIVFDARQAPPGLPRQLTHQQLDVRFAPRDSTADELITELIRAHHSPRQLTVVSSDHRVQVAASRRKATPLDSDRWLDQLRRTSSQEYDAKPISDATSKPISDASSPFPPGYGEDLLEEPPWWK